MEIKDDTLYIDIRVNPSDFPLKKEHIGLLISIEPLFFNYRSLEPSLSHIWAGDL